MMAPRRPGRSFSDERQLIELAKTIGLEAIAKKIGKTPKAVRKMAMRLGVSIQGKAKAGTGLFRPLVA
jgi:hypothetical protein